MLLVWFWMTSFSEIEGYKGYKELYPEAPTTFEYVEDVSSSPLVDFDANLLHADLREIKDSLMEKAKEMGVQYFVVPGSTLEDSTQVLEFCKERGSEIVATAGVHPYHVMEEACNDDSLEKLRLLTENEKCHAVGECGLDYSEGFPAPELQANWFRKQVDLALEVNKPLFLHERNAHSDFLSALDAAGFSPDGSQKNPVECIVHCFTGNINELECYVKRGFYIGLTGYVMNRLQPEELMEWMKIIPSDKILLETDAPYMGFPGCRISEGGKGKKAKQRYPNVPAALPLVVNSVANAAGISPKTLAYYAFQNACRLFPRAFK
jgi:TatD DNase family protein